MKSIPLSVQVGLYIGFYLCILLILPHSLTNAFHVARYVVEDPSEGTDIAYAVCIYSDVLYVVGSTNYRMFIEGISISNNSRLFSWVSGWIGELYDCVAVNSSLFVIGIKQGDNGGKWFVGVLSERLDLITWRESYDRGTALSLVYSDGYLYIVGYGATAVDGYRDVFWIVEKVDANNIFSFTYTISNPSRGSDFASAVGVNPASRKVWIAGTNGDRRMWRVEVYDRDLKLIASRDLDIPNYPYSIAFDSSGDTYVAGTSRVVRIDGRLEIVARAEVGGSKAVLYNDSHLLLVTQHSNEFGFQSHYIYILDSDLDVVDAICTTCGKNYSMYVDRGKPALVGKELYVAGYGIAGSRYRGDTFIVLYSLSIPDDLPIVRKAGDSSRGLISIVPLVAIAVAGILSILAIWFVRSRKKLAESIKTKKDRFLLPKMDFAVRCDYGS